MLELSIDGLRLSILMRGTFFLLLLIFVIYSVILGYHWFTYGIQKQTSMLALVIYLGGAALLFIIMGSVLALQ